jgi:DNA-binding GntR family transcriptional regulator
MTTSGSPILQGRLDETSRLTEDFLSNQLGISKSPVREALNRLEAEGLIHIEPRKGACLRRLTMVEINEFYDSREALEAHVVRTANVTAALLGKLRQSIERQRMRVRANDKPHYSQEDVRFHSLLAQATGNGHLCTVLDNIQNLIWLSLRSAYNLSSSTAPDFHDAIVKALEQGSIGAAEQAMREHIHTVRHQLLRFMEDNGRPSNSRRHRLTAQWQRIARA